VGRVSSRSLAGSGMAAASGMVGIVYWSCRSMHGRYALWVDSCGRGMP
jgi:hypothetical protein